MDGYKCRKLVFFSLVMKLVVLDNQSREVLMAGVGLVFVIQSFGEIILITTYALFLSKCYVSHRVYDHLLTSIILDQVMLRL